MGLARRLRANAALRHLALTTLLALAACTGPGPLPTATLTVLTPPATVNAPTAPAGTSAPTATATIASTATLPPRAAQLTICLAGEPQSLYRYARPEPNRDNLLAALYDGPIDQTPAADGGLLPVILTTLPSLTNGDATLQTVSVAPGDRVVDALSRVVPLAVGTRLLLANGSVITATGDQPLDLPQWVLTFHLRPGLTWSDGLPLTAADSVFAFTLGNDVDSQDPLRPVAERTASYTATDDLTIVWTGLPGYLDPLALTNFWPPLPQHQLGELTPSEIADSEAANRAPLGWGPFVIDNWTPGVELVLNRNPNYWRAAEGLPRAERLTYRFVADAAAQVAALEAGACDLAPSGPGLTALTDAATAAGLVAAPLPSFDLQLLLFGLAPAPGYASPGSAALADPQVRQALAHCLDRAALAPAPHLAAADSYVPGASEVRYPFDPAHGRALLAAAGWTDSDGDGVVDQAGAPLTLTLVGGPSDNAAAVALLSAVQRQLERNCGVAINVQPLTRGELFSDWPAGVLFGRRFDLALFTWRTWPANPCALFLSDQLPGDANPAGANASGYANPAFDDACRQQLVTLRSSPPSPAQAIAAEQFAADLPALPLFYWPQTRLARASVGGFVFTGTLANELWNLEAITP